MSINPLAFKRLSTARLFIKPSGGTQYLNLGDVTEHEYNPDIQRLDIESPGNGFSNISAQLIKTVKQMYSVTLNETTPEVLALSYNAKAATSANQTLATGATATFTAVKYREAYLLGKRNVTNVVVTDTTTSTVLTQDVDYYLDAGIGYIELIRGGVVTAGDNLGVTFNAPAINRWSITPGTLITQQGDIQLFKKDQFADDPVEEITFFGQYFISQRSGGSKDLATYKVDLFPQLNFKVKYRDIIV